MQSEELYMLLTSRLEAAEEKASTLSHINQELQHISKLKASPVLSCTLIGEMDHMKPCYAALEY